MHNPFCLIAGLYTIFSNLCTNMTLINLSNYPYPSPTDPKYTYIPIFATTDMHGYAFTRKIKDTKYGGVSLLYSYLQNFRSDWGNRLLYFDSGDKYQGGLESTFSNGTIMSEYYNYAKLDLSVLGNHEFDNKMEFLLDKMNEVNSDFLTTNLYSIKSGEFYQLPHSKQSKILELPGGIRIGVIGYTPETSINADVLKEIKFMPFDVIVTEAKRLRELKDKDKVDAIILFIHEGLLECTDRTYDINIYTSKTKQYKDNCKSTTLTQFLEEEGKDLIDAVIGGHVHQPGYFYVNDIPIVHSPDKSRYFHILYLPFEGKTLVKSKIAIEGPVPLCEKISEKTKRCEFSDRDEPKYNYHFHNYLIRFNREMENKVLKKYETEMAQYQEYVCTNNIITLMRGNVENPLGNLQCDILRTQAKAHFAVLNNGCFRSTWYEGEIYVEHVFDMNPFKNTVITFDMTGEELTKMMSGYLMVKLENQYQSGGMRMTFDKSGKMISITRSDGSAIEKETMYTVSSHNHFLTSKEFVKMKSDGVYTDRNVKDYGLMTTIIINGLRELKEINEKDFWEADPTKRRVVILNE